MDVIFLDFQKAFDTVPHMRSQEKLKHIELEGKYLQE